MKTEKNFENDLITLLTQYNWEKEILKNPTEKKLIDNWRKIISENNKNKSKDRLDKDYLSETEMEQIINKVGKLQNSFEVNRFINEGTVTIKRDNNNDDGSDRIVTLDIYNPREMGKGQARYQIAQQPIFKPERLGNKRQGDLLLLINGMPVIHIELKKMNKTVRHASSQIQTYINDGVYKGIYKLVQVFVAMTEDDNRYFVFPSDGIIRKNNLCKWTDPKNNIHKKNYKDFAEEFLSLPMVHQLIGYYTVREKEDSKGDSGELKILRGYQINAIKCLFREVYDGNNYKGEINEGGYIWHTTGSGKTFTSYKAAQIIHARGFAKKVVFVFDRIELSIQSLDEFRRIADNPEQIKGTKSANDLISKLKNERAILIETSIQKLSDIYENTNLNQEDIKKIEKNKIVFIFDECHRSTFGNMMAKIKKMFTKAIFFGFTGTPIFEGTKKISTTKEIFGREIHRYTIMDGLEDGNVLGFHKKWVETVDYNDLIGKIKEERNQINDCQSSSKRIFKIKKSEQEYYSGDKKNIESISAEKYLRKKHYGYKHRDLVIQNILDNWKTLSNEYKFSGILATSSIKEAVCYFSEIHKKQSDKKFMRGRKKINITAIFDVGQNDNPDLINDDKKYNMHDRRNDMDSIFERYKKQFNVQIEFARYKQDVITRLKRISSYNNLEDDKKLDLVIVVEQLLTGFDSKWVSMLYLDKVLEQERIIQAFSRTNRICDSSKPFGIIRYYRKPFTMDQNIKDAVKNYSGDRPFDLFVPKNYDIISGINYDKEEIDKTLREEGVLNIKKEFVDLEDKLEFIKKYNKLNKNVMIGRIQGIDFGCEYKDEDIVDNKGIIKNNLTEEHYYALKKKKDIVLKSLPKKNLESILVDIDYFYQEGISEKIDYEYMNSNFEKFVALVEKNEQTDTAIRNLKNSFSDLSEKARECAEMILIDFNTGKTKITPGKKFMDYIDECVLSKERFKMLKITNAFGINENLFADMMKQKNNEDNIGYNGTFDSLADSYNHEIAWNYIKTLNPKLDKKKCLVYVRKILRKCLINDNFNNFDLDTEIKKLK